MSKSLLIISRQAPWSGPGAREALDIALAGGAFDLPLAMLFLDDGVLQLVAGQQPSALQQKDLAANLQALPLFGVGIVFGAIWAEVAWGRFWNWDAKETVSMITWVLYAAYLHARATAGWKSTAAAWINVFALCMTVFNMTYVNFVAASLHSYAGLN